MPTDGGSDNRTAEESEQPRSTFPHDHRDVVQAGLQIVGLYFAYKHNEGLASMTQALAVVVQLIR